MGQVKEEVTIKKEPQMSNHIQSGATGPRATAAPNGHGGTLDGAISELPVVQERRLQKVLLSIECQLPHSVRELAEQVHLSPTHLQRLFKNETGVHISNLLYERRLAMAAKLLTTTEMEIKQIAYFVGYGHPSSFDRAFQRRFGKSPRQYRHQQLREKA